MNLNELSLTELASLNDALRLIHEGATILSKLPPSGEQELVVRLRPGEPVAITTHFVMPGMASVTGLDPLVLIEDLPAEPVSPVLAVISGDLPPDPVQAAPSKLADAVPVVADLAVDIPAAPPVVPAPRKTAARVPSPAYAGMVMGPLSDAERETIRVRWAQGKTAAEIAIELNRKVQTVALATSRLPKTPAADANAPRAETTGGPRNDADTGQAPAAAQDQTCAAPNPAPPAPPPAAQPVAIPAPDGRPLRQREIDVFLSNVKRRKGFDAEIDLELAEGLGRGDKLAEIAANLGIDAKDLADRWADLKADIADFRGRLSLADQAYLIAELRRRVTKARGIAA